MAASDPTPQPPPLPEHAPVAPLSMLAEPGPRRSPTVADHVRGLVRSGEAFIRGVLGGNNSGNARPHLQQQHQHHHQYHLHHHNQQEQYEPHPPNRAADMVKRLQRETFPDVMKLLEKHEQIERILSLYKDGKGFQFPDFPIRVKIALDAVGALLLPTVDGGDGQFDEARAVLGQAGYRTGLSSRFVFESRTRGKDTIAAELATSRLQEAGGSRRQRLGDGEAVLGRPVELTRLQYCARVNKRVSLILVPFGAQCNDLLGDPRTLQSQASFHGPPSFSERHNCAAGLRIKGSRFTASIAELLFGAADSDNRATTFGQVSCDTGKDFKISVSGLWQARSPSTRFDNLGILAVPMGRLRKPGKPATAPGAAAETGTTTLKVDVQGPPTGAGASASAASVAVMVDCEMYDSIKAEGWVQVERSGSERHWPVRFGFSVSDTPEDKLGWGVRTGGAAEGDGHQLQHQHLEGFINLSFGRGSLQPGIVYATEGDKWRPALFLRSSWFM